MLYPAFRIVTSGLLLLAAVAPALAQPEVSGQLIRPDAQDMELPGGIHFSLNFGAAVAVSGRTAAIGIPYDTELAPGPGRVGIYRMTSEGWIRSATLAPSNVEDIRFGRDVDLCGSLMFVAAERSIYAFQFRGSRWREVQRIPLGSRDNELGPLVCSNTSFAFSLMGTDPQGQPVGSVHIFERKRGGHFTRVARLRASGPNAVIGRSLAMERGVLVAGAEPDAVHVFVRHGHRWIERQRLQSTGLVGADVGAAVAIRDRIIIAGAPQRDVGLLFSRGDAFVYLPYRGSWFESQSLNDAKAVPAFEFSINIGARVAMGRRLAAVTASVGSDTPRPEHTVFVFDRIGETFTNGRAIYGADPNHVGDFIADMDMAGRRLIVSRHETLAFSERVIGEVVIFEFQGSPEAPAQVDEDEQAELRLELVSPSS
jgi:hypothetical protein